MGIELASFVSKHIPKSLVPVADVLVGLPVLVAGVIGAGIVGRSLSSFVRARQLGAPSASEVLSGRRRPPVLYLRSFKHDPIADHRLGFATRSEEEQMTAVLERIGPVVAIGAPGEELPTLGAARDYVTDDEWQGWVLKMMPLASLVIFRASDTDAFWWEVAAAAAHVSPERKAFLLPFDPKSYSEFRARIARHLHKPLPEVLPALPPGANRGKSDIWGLLYFDEGENPILGALAEPTSLWSSSLWTNSLSVSLTQPLRLYFEKMFKPLLRRNNARSFPLPTVTGLFWTPLLLLTAVLLFPLILCVYAWRRIRGKPTNVFGRA